MKNKKGYTMPELLVLMTVIGIIALALILKTSYAFENNDSEILENYYSTIERQAIKYGEEHKDKFNENGEIIIDGKTLAEEKYLPVSEDGTILSDIADFSNVKIVIKIKDDKVISKIQK